MVSFKILIGEKLWHFIDFHWNQKLLKNRNCQNQLMFLQGANSLNFYLGKTPMLTICNWISYHHLNTGRISVVSHHNGTGARCRRRHKLRRSRPKWHCSRNETFGIHYQGTGDMRLYTMVLKPNIQHKNVFVQHRLQNEQKSTCTVIVHNKIHQRFSSWTSFCVICQLCTYLLNKIERKLCLTSRICKCGMVHI